MVVSVGLTDCVPEVDLIPPQPSPAIQEVAKLELQLREELCPLTIDVGLAVKVSVGGFGGSGGCDTVTCTLAVADPPGPVQLRVKVVLTVGRTTSLPESGFDPLQTPVGLDMPVHAVALAVVHLRVDPSPRLIAAGLACKLPSGEGAGAHGADDTEPTTRDVLQFSASGVTKT